MYVDASQIYQLRLLQPKFWGRLYGDEVRAVCSSQYLDQNIPWYMHVLLSVLDVHSYIPTP